MKKSILFVCTGNVFRSVSAEYAFKKYLKENKIQDWKVASAGIIAKKEPIDPKAVSTLKSLGISNINHKQKRLTSKMLKEYDVVVAIAENHIEFMKSRFRYNDAILFNELVKEERASILDIDEVPNFLRNRPEVEKKIDRTIHYIFKNTPALFKNARDRYYLFSDFVSGDRLHRNGYPFIKLYETKNTTSFMSIDLPRKEDGHILVIPKKRYKDLSEIPSNVLSELAETIKTIGRAISRNHGGFNVLLNNGSDAGQYIFHTHFHIIPRNYNDGIKIEVWDHANIPLKRFIKINNQLIEQIKREK
jgi:protein-tyrosine phosphatase